MSALRERLAAILVWAASVWPLWVWWIRRLAEPLDTDVLAWATVPVVVALLWWRSGADEAAARIPGWKWLFAAAMLASFHVVRLFVPPTASGVFAVAAGAALLSPESGKAGGISAPVLALGLMGLPTMMILDLFFGLTLREVAVCGASAVMSICGMPVARSGLELSMNGVAVWVDAPCAGVRMAGVGLWLAFFVSAVLSFRWRRTIALAAVAVAATLLGNIVRVVVLTALEFAKSGIPRSAVAHESIGAAAFFWCAVMVVGAGVWLERRGRSR